MNIAIYASAFYPHLGGVEELVRQLAHALRARGDSVIVLTNQWPRSLPEEELFEGFPLFRFPMRVPEGSRKAQLTYLLSHVHIRRRMIRVLEKHRIDLLHVQCVSSGAHYALSAKQHLKLPLVVTTQGELTMDASRLFQRSVFSQELMRACLAQADAITGCSVQTLAEVEEFFGKPFGERARVIYNGIRIQDFEDATPHQRARPYVFAIGRHVVQKGFDVLLRAFALTAEIDGTHDLLLAGNGKEHARLQQLAVELGIADRVHFVGRVDHMKAVRLFLGCSFFVLPSRHEPQGIVNLEAMAAGKAVIASRVGGVPEIVLEGQTGILVPGEDADALAIALLRLLQNPDLSTRLGQAGQERARSFDWSAIAEQYVSVYESACLQTKTKRTSKRDSNRGSAKDAAR